MEGQDDMGDGFERRQGSGRQEQEITSSDNSAASAAAMQALVASLHETHGTPHRVRPDKFKVAEEGIFRMFAARGPEQKEMVRTTISYIAIVHGTGTNVDLTTIDVTPPGMRTLKASDYVSAHVDQRFYRRFMAWYSQRAITMVRSSQELRNALADRCVRNGLPTTDIEAMIDFLDVTSGVPDRVIAARNQGKYAALARANNQGPTLQTRQAALAASTLHAYHDDNGVQDA